MATHPIRDPDVLIRQVPEMDFAVAEFNSVPMNTLPFRDIPSIFIAHLNRPNVSAAEPDWERLLRYFVGNRSHHGTGNIQDLYMFLTRVALPNVIIQNRHLLLSMYLARRALPVSFRLRYDAWDPSYLPDRNPDKPSIVDTRNTGNAPTNKPTQGTSSSTTRPIFRSQSTPNGDQFVQWLNTPPNTPYPHPPVPSQMSHHPSDVDSYLTDDESAIRCMDPHDLVRKATDAFHVWWWITCQTAALERYEKEGWFGVEKEF